MNGALLLRGARLPALFLILLLLPRGGAAADLPVDLTLREEEERNSFLLGRAVHELGADHVREARQLLLACDLRSPDTFPGADRAAFLLAESCLRLGDYPGFQMVANQVEAWRTDSIYSRWIAFLSLAVQGEDPGAALAVPALATEGPVAVLAAIVLLEAGENEPARRRLGRVPDDEEVKQLLLYLDGLAAVRLGDPAPESWQTLSLARPTSAAEANLVGAATLHLAVDAIETGHDPEPYLERVPPASRFAPRALHLQALLAEERGDTEIAEELLTRIYSEFPRYEGRPETVLQLGAQALDDLRSGEAQDYYRVAEQDWLAQRARLGDLAGNAGVDAVWTSWDARAPWPETLGLDLEPARTSARDLRAESLDLNRSASAPELPRSLAWATPGVVDSLGFLAPPPAAEMTRVDHLRRELEATLASLEGIRWERDREIERLDGLTRYLERGRALVEAEEEALTPTRLRLRYLIDHLQELLGRLEALEEEAELRFLRRATEELERCEAQLVWLDALERFFVAGPNRERRELLPPAVPGRAELLREERELTERMVRFLEAFAAGIPALLDRSLAEVWGPRLLDTARRLDLWAESQEVRILGLEAVLDSSLVAGRTSPELRRLDIAEIAGEARADSLGHAHAEARSVLARRGIEETAARLDAAREAIDYGLAAAAYQITVRDLAALHSEEKLVPAAGLVEANRTEALARLTTFLGRHPESFARGESRFRLADLLLLEAKDEFDRKMERFLGEGGLGEDEGRAMVPFVDYDPAIDLYRAMLAEDRDFLHQDAVLFNLGMILSDQSDPGASPLLTELVTDYPESPFCQEAYLRLGDDLFAQARYAACVPLYEQAVAGPNAGFAAIALYRIGWAEFSEDDFFSAADAFRRLLDLYDSGEEITLKTDLKSEGEDYLIHSLARAGGAPVFASYFDGIGTRPYEMRVLLGMARLLDEFSLYAQAAEADVLFLERYPFAPGALTSARRLVETYERSNRPERAREARLAVAPAFAPGGTWYNANLSDSLRAEAGSFARDCYKQVALYHHHRARDGKGGEDSWQTALDLYNVILRTWPHDDEADKLHAYAGEAAGQLQDYPAALAHFEQATFEFYGKHSMPNGSMERYITPGLTDTSTFLHEVDWQRLSLTDAWYLSTRAEGAEGAPGLGSDSLAAALRLVAQGFVERHPEDPRSPDVAWRMANITFAHGKYAEATEDMAEMMRRYPDDARAPRAGALRGDAFYRAGFFDRAGSAYEEALGLARSADHDSLIAALTPLLPHCAYRHAETVAGQGEGGSAPAAALFESMAERWPDDELAPQARYRAGLGYREAGDPDRAVAAWSRFLEIHPDHEYSKDAHHQIASTWEAAGRTADAARAYERVSLAFPEDEGASDALLKASELLTASGDPTGAEALQLSYVERFPEDVETGMAILAGIAVRELDALGPDRPVSMLTARDASGEPVNRLGAYLEQAEAHPDLASPPILARVRFLEGEERFPAYRDLALTQPLEVSIEAKKTALEALITAYGKCAEWGVAEWTRASAYRIGEALVAFGTALETSERPPGLEGEDLVAYEDVLYEEAWGFQDKGETAWAEILKETMQEAEDPGRWIARTRESLWPRLAQRFLFMPEVEFPLVAAERPAPPDDGVTPLEAEGPSVSGTSMEDLQTPTQE